MRLFQKKTKPNTYAIVRKPRGSFSQKPSVLREAKLAKQDAKTTFSQVGFGILYGFLWILFAVTVIYIFAFSSFFSVETLHVEGVNDIPQAHIDEFVREQLQGTYGGLIPRNNLLFIVSDTMETKLRDHFKKIRSVSVQKTWSHTMDIRVEERKTVIVWCSDEACFYIDEAGYAYAPVDVDSLDTVSGGFLRIIDTSAAAVEPTDPIIDTEFVNFAIDIQGTLQKEFSIDIDTQCTTSSRYSDELTCTTKDGWLLRMNVRIKKDTLVRMLRSLLNKEISADRKTRLKYIDVRTENRAYYSIEGETVSAPEPEEQKKDDATMVSTNPNEHPSSKESQKEKKKE